MGPNRALYSAAQISSGASLTAFTAPWAMQAGHMLPERRVRYDMNTPRTVAKTTIISMPVNGAPGYSPV